MADPIVPYTLNIVGGSAMVGDIIVEDITQFNSAIPTANKIIIQLDSTQKATVDLSNLPSGFSNGDIIEIRANGIRAATSTHTVNTAKGSAKITLSQTSAAYAGASVLL